MTEDEAVAIADAFIRETRGHLPPRRFARRKDEARWNVSYETILPNSVPGAVVDGPTLIAVDVATRTARYLGF